jgi:hypothetical protein
VSRNCCNSGKQLPICVLEKKFADSETFLRATAKSHCTTRARVRIEGPGAGRPVIVVPVRPLMLDVIVCVTACEHTFVVGMDPPLSIHASYAPCARCGKSAGTAFRHKTRTDYHKVVLALRSRTESSKLVKVALPGLRKASNKVDKSLLSACETAP